MVREIATHSEFEELLSSNENHLIVVDFTATWCGPCQRIAPIIETLSNEMKDVVFVKIDVDKNQETTEKCGINSMPTFHFYKNKALLEKVSGASEDLLKDAIAKHK